MRRRAFHLATPSGEACARWRVIGAAVPKCIRFPLKANMGLVEIANVAALTTVGAGAWR